MAEAEIPVHQDLSSPEGRSEAGLDDSRADLFAGATLIAMRTVPGDEASCLNLYRPERPRLLGVPAAMIERGGFRFHDLSGRAGDPWRLLEGAPEPGVIPVFGDEATVTWILHMKLGEDLVITDETGGALRLRIVGLLEGSPFQSELLVSEKHLLAHFPSRAGYARFLIDVPPERAADLSRALEEGLAPHGFDVSAVADRIAGYREVENTYLATFQVLGGLGLLLGTIGLGIVALRNVAERRGELAALRAFGFSRRRVARMVVLETLSLLLLGLTIGTLSALAAVAPRLVSGGAPWGALGLTLGGVLAFGMLSSLGAVSGALRAPLLPALKSER